MGGGGATAGPRGHTLPWPPGQGVAMAKILEDKSLIKEMQLTWRRMLTEGGLDHSDGTFPLSSEKRGLFLIRRKNEVCVNKQTTKWPISDDRRLVEEGATTFHRGVNYSNRKLWNENLSLETTLGLLSLPTTPFYFGHVKALQGILRQNFVGPIFASQLFVELSQRRSIVLAL